MKPIRAISKLLLVGILLATTATAPAIAREVKGINISETAVTDSGARLQLNGAGVRSKFVVDVYVAALYLAQKAHDAAAALQATSAKRMQLHFLRDIDAKKIVAAWNDGFTANVDAAERTRMQDRIDRFNALFPSLRTGDVVALDYAPSRGTRVIVGGQVKGTIAGDDFAQALFRIWLGEYPVSTKLKGALLGS